MLLLPVLSACAGEHAAENAAAGDSESPIRIKTKSGTVEATGSRFYVQTAMKIKPLTRLLVIAGASAVLSNAGGSAEAAPGEIATAEGDDPHQVWRAQRRVVVARSDREVQSHIAAAAEPLVGRELMEPTCRAAHV